MEFFLLINRNNQFLKKFFQITNSWFRCSSVKNKSDSVVVNSVPKSGTHLLHQVLLAGGYRDYYQFIASTPSWSMKLKKSSAIKKRLLKIKRREVILSHMFYDEVLAESLYNLKLPMIFLVRDPRATLLSEINYLTSMNRWHKCHKYFAHCASFSERFELCFNGIKDDSIFYPSYLERLEMYCKWTEANSVLTVKFEDLISSTARYACIGRIVNYLSSYNCDMLSGSNAYENMYNSVNPQMSHTYTGLDPDRWKTFFTKNQLNRVEKTLAPICEKLNYNTL